MTTLDGAIAQDPERFGVGRIFYLTSEAIVAADLQTERIVLWNPAAELLFGYSSVEAIGMRLDLLVPEELRGQHLAGIRQYRGGREAALVGRGPVAVPAVTKGGDARDIALSLTDVSEGETRRFVLAVVRDVTDQLRAERELATMNQAMRDFVAAASHDLRTPLTSVLGFARLLVDNGDALAAEQRREMVDAILRGAQKAALLVDDLLTLSQIQAGVVARRPRTVSVAAVAREANAQTGSGAVVAVDDSAVALVDPDHLERMLVNYLSNAARYGAPPVEVTAASDGRTVEVRVRDSGAGVPEAFVDRLFTSFARADSTSKDGTGLGLSIVKGLAEANGGRAFYERDPHVGSCFAVVLPAAAS